MNNLIRDLVYKIAEKIYEPILLEEVNEDMWEFPPPTGKLYYIPYKYPDASIT